MRFHLHTWTYLGKEYHVRTKSKHFSNMISDKTEKQEINVTTIRFFCKRCSMIKAQTVDGKITVNEIARMGVLGESDE